MSKAYKQPTMLPPLRPNNLRRRMRNRRKLIGGKGVKPRMSQRGRNVEMAKIRRGLDRAKRRLGVLK